MCVYIWFKSFSFTFDYIFSCMKKSQCYLFISLADEGLTVYLIPQLKNYLLKKSNTSIFNTLYA